MTPTIGDFISVTSLSPGSPSATGDVRLYLIDLHRVQCRATPAGGSSHPGLFFRAWTGSPRDMLRFLRIRAPGATRDGDRSGSGGRFGGAHPTGDPREIRPCPLAARASLNLDPLRDTAQALLVHGRRRWHFGDWLALYFVSCCPAAHRHARSTGAIWWAGQYSGEGQNIGGIDHDI
jgi:hypothetical protein